MFRMRLEIIFMLNVMAFIMPSFLVTVRILIASRTEPAINAPSQTAKKIFL